MTRAGAPRSLAVVLSAFAIAFPVWLLVATFRRASNVPLRDEWVFAHLSFLMRTGHLQWADIWTPHNEHRVVIPKLVFLAIDKSVGWNLLLDNLVGVVALIAASFVLSRIIRTEIGPGIWRYVALAGMSALLFSPAQFQVFAEAFGLGICTLCALVVIAVLGGPPARASFVVAWLAAIIASLTSAQGLILWFVGLTALWLANWSPRSRIVWTISAAVVITVYFQGGFGTTAGHVSDPRMFVDVPAYVLIFLTAPVNYGEPAYLRVLTAFVVVAATAFLLFSMRSDIAAKSRTIIPWLLCIEYALLESVTIAISRLGFGLVQATSSRYVSLSIFLYIGILGLFLSRLERFQARAIRIAAVCVFAFLGVLALAAAINGDARWSLWTAERRRVGIEIGDGRFANSAKVYPDEAQLRTFISELCLVHDSPVGCPPNGSR